MLAVAASHLAHHTAATNPSRHRVAERALLSAALDRFRPALVARPLTTERADALLVTSIMINNLAFAGLNGEDALDLNASWVFSRCADRLNWLGLQLGLKPLLAATAPFREASLLRPMYEASDEAALVYAGDNAGDDTAEDGVPSHWDRLAAALDAEMISMGSGGGGGGGDNTVEWIEEPHPAREAVRILAAIRRLPAAAHNVFLFVRLIAALDPRFVGLLRAGSEGGHWILGYWLRQMGRLDLWWSRPRSTRDGAAIRLFLARRRVTEWAGDDGVMWRWLMADYDAV
ncbi:hypothetical protein SPI_01472 [Niveomyces insectorum RCEF 264]|uniref:C6 zinc finger domain containing protein n=1 Tax=Niveomyces insectorum RCEF 264 TaxID=1081102 RepID=A0A167YZT3_9HYPO|nr:hypothetical protein SPI_01472 [Niveomyces insectorum RCEF 264]